jgi:hypothetical protein
MKSKGRQEANKRALANRITRGVIIKNSKIITLSL